MTGGYIIDRFMSGMNIVYGLGWKASKRIKIPPVELGKWREAGAWYRIKDIFIGANNSWSFIIAFNFYCTVINISGKQLDIFTCLFSSTHLMFKYETLLNANCCSCTFQGLLLSRFETVCLMYYAFPFSIDLICVCEIRLSLHAVTLATLAFFEFVIFPSLI